MNEKHQIHSHSTEAEEAVLGAILIDNSVYKKVCSIVKPENFYQNKHKLLFNNMAEMLNGGTPVDSILVVQRLRESGDLEKAGGAYEITGLRDNCPTTSNAIHYAKIIKEHANSRAQRRIGQKFARGDASAEKELIALINDGIDVPDFRKSDAGNADLLKHLFGDIIRYNHTEGKWFIWNKQYWKPDDKAQIYELAKKAAQSRAQNALTITDSTLKKQALHFAINSENQQKLMACINSAKSIPELSTTKEDWDKSCDMLQCDNGLLLLNEGVKFRSGQPEAMISKSTLINYDATATCPQWKKAISEILSDDMKMIEFVQRAIGYSLTGFITEQKFFLLHGSGANGKSLMMEILRDIMGDYSQNTRFDTFERKQNKQTNEIARLHNARLVTANESGDTKRLDTELLKEVTGGDKVTARYLYNESFNFSPEFKLWLSSNSLPKVTDTSLGFWRRVLIIPLRRSFIGKDADPELINKLKDEIPGILNWALGGYIEWKKQGLNPPSEVTKATTEYQNESDIVAEFVEDNQIKKSDAFVTAKVLYEKFIKWFDENYSEKPITQQMFGRKMKLLGYESEKQSGRRIYRIYIGNKSNV